MSQTKFFLFQISLWRFQCTNTIEINVCYSITLTKRNKNPTAVTLIYILLSLFSISILMFERCIFEAGMAGPWLLRYVRCIFISLLSQRHFATTANVLHNGTKSFLKKQTFSEVAAVYRPSKTCLLLKWGAFSYSCPLYVTLPRPWLCFTMEWNWFWRKKLFIKLKTLDILAAINVVTSE